MQTILFQGDSITDVFRVREDAGDLGRGYPALVEARLGVRNPAGYQVLNRGVSGDRVVDLYARIRRDLINLRPQYVSILIGVNDVWHEVDGNGVSTPKFRKLYAMLLEEAREALPDAKFLLLEPFVLDGSATHQRIAWFREEVAARGAVVRELAAEFGTAFLPLQEDLNALTAKAPAPWWLYDGVHPTAHFHQYLADRWLELFDTLTEGTRHDA